MCELRRNITIDILPVSTYFALQINFKDIIIIS